MAMIDVATGKVITSGALVGDKNAFTDATKSVTKWPVWLIIVCSLGGALFFLLLFIMCMCITASTRKKTARKSVKSRKDQDYGELSL